MSGLFAQLMTPQLKVAFVIVVIAIVVLYVLSIVWVVRDAYIRNAKWKLWGIVALVPIVGVIAYCLLRPALYQIDKDEQELEIALKQRELMRYGECGACGYPVESDYIVCPHCHTQLKNMCPACHKACDPSWSVCPWCATPVAGGMQRRGSAQRTRTTTPEPQDAVTTRQPRQERSRDARPQRERRSTQ